MPCVWSMHAHRPAMHTQHTGPPAKQSVHSWGIVQNSTVEDYGDYSAEIDPEGVHVCMCVCARARASATVCTSLCVYVCVCVCVWGGGVMNVHPAFGPYLQSHTYAYYATSLFHAAAVDVEPPQVTVPAVTPTGSSRPYPDSAPDLSAQQQARGGAAEVPRPAPFSPEPAASGENLAPSSWQGTPPPATPQGGLPLEGQGPLPTAVVSTVSPRPPSTHTPLGSSDSSSSPEIVHSLPCLHYANVYCSKYAHDITTTPTTPTTACTGDEAALAHVIEAGIEFSRASDRIQELHSHAEVLTARLLKVSAERDKAETALVELTQQHEVCVCARARAVCGKGRGADCETSQGGGSMVCMWGEGAWCSSMRCVCACVCLCVKGTGGGDTAAWVTHTKPLADTHMTRTHYTCTLDRGAAHP